MVWDNVRYFFKSVKKGDTGDMFSAFLHPVSILHSAFICIILENTLRRKPPYLHSQHNKYTKNLPFCQGNSAIWGVF